MWSRISGRDGMIEMTAGAQISWEASLERTMDKRVGRVTAFAADCLVPVAGATLTAELIAIDYQRWCAGFSYAPLRDGPFRKEFVRLARQIELISEANDADILFRDVALRAAKASA